MKNLRSSIILALFSSFLFFAACSEESKVKGRAEEWAQQKVAEEAQEEAKSLNSAWLRQAYQDFITNRAEVKILEVEMSGSDSAVVKLQILKMNGDLRSNLLGVAGKVPPDGSRRFNFSDGATAVQQQLGLTETTYWAPTERVSFQKGPNGWSPKN